jgi:enoyl-CoA hydratase
VLAGAEGNFCAGADLKALANSALGVTAASTKESSGPAVPATQCESPSRVNSVLEPVAGDRLGLGPMGPTRLRLTKPTVAAVEGFCVAGGLELALW